MARLVNGAVYWSNRLQIPLDCQWYMHCLQTCGMDVCFAVLQWMCFQPKKKKKKEKKSKKKENYWLKLVTMQFISSIGPPSSHLCSVIMEPRGIISSPLHPWYCFSCSQHWAPLVLLTPKAAGHVAQGTTMQQILCTFTAFHPGSFLSAVPIFKETSRCHLQ